MRSVTPAVAGVGASAVRLSPTAHSAEARGDRGESQEAVPALQGRTPDGQEAWRSQTSAGHAGADDDPTRSQSTLEPGLRLGRLDRWQAVPDPVRDRRLQPGGLGNGGG